MQICCSRSRITRSNRPNTKTAGLKSRIAPQNWWCLKSCTVQRYRLQQSLHRRSPYWSKNEEVNQTKRTRATVLVGLNRDTLLTVWCRRLNSALNLFGPYLNALVAIRCCRRDLAENRRDKVASIKSFSLVNKTKNIVIGFRHHPLWHGATKIFYWNQAQLQNVHA